MTGILPRDSIRLLYWDYRIETTLTEKKTDRQTDRQQSRQKKSANMTTPSNTKVHTGVTLLITMGRGRGAQNRPCVLGTHMLLFSVSHNAGVSFFLSLHHTINSFENISISCFSPLQLSTQIKLFLGAKKQRRGICLPFTPQVRLMSLRTEKIRKQYLGL